MSAAQGSRATKKRKKEKEKAKQNKNRNSSSNSNRNVKNTVIRSHITDEEAEETIDDDNYNDNSGGTISNTVNNSSNSSKSAFNSYLDRDSQHSGGLRGAGSRTLCPLQIEGSFSTPQSAAIINSSPLMTSTLKDLLGDGSTGRPRTDHLERATAVLAYLVHPMPLAQFYAGQSVNHSVTPSQSLICVCIMCMCVRMDVCACLFVRMNAHIYLISSPGLGGRSLELCHERGHQPTRRTLQCCYHHCHCCF